MQPLPIITLAEINSTNSYLKEHESLLENNFQVVRAIKQTSGRGRQERHWQMQAGLDLAFSFVYHVQTTNINISGITLTIGLALQRALNHSKELTVQLKWPNDILHDRKKLAGILCELVYLKNKPIVIAGIGINVNSISFRDFEGIATSLRNILRQEISIEKLLHSIMQAIQNILPSGEPPLSTAILKEYKKHCINIGQKIRYQKDSGTAIAQVIDIAPSGAIVLESHGLSFNYTGEISNSC